MRYVLFFLAVLISASCSVVDGDDRAQIEDTIEALPPDVMRQFRVWAAAQRVQWWLEQQNHDRKIIDVECRTHSSKGPTKWISSKDVTIRDMLLCLDVTKMDYSNCAKLIAGFVHDDLAIKLREEVGPAMADMLGLAVECRHIFVPGFEPDQVAAEVRDSNEARIGDMDRLWELLTVGQLANTLIASPLPPPLPGFAPGGALRVLLPALCALGSKWGCPDDEHYPGGDKP